VYHVYQLRQGFWRGAVCKCGTHKALDFPTLQFGTRRSVFQIHFALVQGTFRSRPFKTRHSPMRSPVPASKATRIRNLGMMVTRIRSTSSLEGDAAWSGQ
jgi:hypothetical protein